MKKNVTVFGLIAGSIITAMMIISTVMCYDDPDFKGNMILGYTGMLIAFAFIFVGIKNYRDKYNNGTITFGKAFKVGLYIALIASTMYVLTWLFEYYLFIPDFMNKYADHVLREAEKSGAGQVEMNSKISEMAKYREWYKNPVLVVLLTYMEVLPIGVVVALLGALVLKKKQKSGLQAA